MAKDPTLPLRMMASQYPEVARGTACTQSSYKAGKTAFLYIGEQGGRYKAMFKLGASRAEAEKLARSAPDDYQVGNTAWVTVRFSADKPMPAKLWKKWLNESYQLSVGSGKSRSTRKKAAKKVAKKARKKK